ncbi:MAG: MarR family transcriptional regulator [Christensenellaceae bacterium]|nr:MarR family transcriptional regulator [Christensenellaceae bacterium]
MEQEPIAGYGWYIKRIDNALAKEAAHNMQANALTKQQGHMLVTLKHAPKGSMTLKELEDRFGAAQSTIAGLVARLEKKGLVEGFHDPDDKRIKRVRLTDAGHAMHQTCRQNVVNSEKRLVSLLTEEERASLLDLLRKVYDAVK